MEKKLNILDLYEEPAYTEESWEHTQPAVYEKRAFSILNLLFSVVCLVPAFTAMSMGHIYWYLYLLFYVLGAAMLQMGLVHLLYPILRRDGADLVGVSCGLLPKEHRIPHRALKNILAQPAVGTKTYSKFLRYYIELYPVSGKTIQLGERHLLEEDTLTLDEYLVPEDLQTQQPERISVIRPMLILDLALLAVGVLGFIVNLAL